MTRPLCILAAVAALLLAAPALQAQDTSAQESRRAALQKEIANWSSRSKTIRPRAATPSTS